MYDKFAGFVNNLQQVGERLRQAQQSYDDAFGQLSSGSGNLLRQTEMLRDLGARATRQLDAGLVEESKESTPSLSVVSEEGAKNEGKADSAGNSD
jgi:DNA recombination protein RmuC